MARKMVLKPLQIASRMKRSEDSPFTVSLSEIAEQVRSRSKLCSDPGRGWGLMEESFKLPIRDIHGKSREFYVQST